MRKQDEVERDIEAFGLRKLNDPPVTHWSILALQHWREHRPKMYKRLKQEGKLKEAVLRAATNTVEALSELIGRGVDPYMAEEAVREMWVLLPTEEDVPNLSERPDPLRYML